VVAGAQGKPTGCISAPVWGWAELQTSAVAEWSGVAGMLQAADAEMTIVAGCKGVVDRLVI
jgi:hypothetical protein